MGEAIHYIPLERGVTKVALMRGDDELSRALVVPMTIRFGRVSLRMDGIGGVATPSDHRHKGYSRRVLEAAIRHMTDGDAVLSMLYGIPDFYPKYGYTTVGPEPVISPSDVKERLTIPDGYTVRRGNTDDLPAIKRIYGDETRDGYGPLVRDDDWWTWSVVESALQPGSQELIVVEGHGIVVAYAYRASKCWWMDQWSRKETSGLKIGEVCATDLPAAQAIFSACRRWAAELGEPGLQISAPSDSRVGQASQFQNVKITTEFEDNAGFMGRTTGLAALVRAIKPELQARWNAAGPEAASCAVTLSTGQEAITLSGVGTELHLESGQHGNDVAEFNEGELARLVLGGFPPGTVLDRCAISPRAKAFLASLFPRHQPFVYPLDRF